MGENAVCRTMHLGGLLESSLPGPDSGPARIGRTYVPSNLVGTVQGTATEWSRSRTFVWSAAHPDNCVPSTAQYPKGVLALYGTCCTVADVLMCPVSTYHNCELPSM